MRTSPTPTAVLMASGPGLQGAITHTATLRGDTTGRTMADWPPPVYPRACGGTARARRAMTLMLGLSPRVRGNLSRRGRGAAASGSIPARAGEPLPPCRGSQPSAVYPRACGGTAPRLSRYARMSGLSPRVRGNLVAGVPSQLVERSIPARAGEPFTRHACPPGNPVYPRACGGTADLTETMVSTSGLSPRVRGNPLGAGGVLFAPRSIPARAGEPASANAVRTAPPVYPRACGGTYSWAAPMMGMSGLSPRVRGNRPNPTRPTCWRRSIPARAGEPRTGCIAPTCGTVYPRACGGTTATPRAACSRRGLSPRVRGNRT